MKMSAINQTLVKCQWFLNALSNQSWFERRFKNQCL